MTRRGLGLLVGVSSMLLYGCEQPTPEMQVVYGVAEAIGGLDRVEEAENVLMTGRGRQYRLGQNRSPTAELPYWEIGEFTRVIDLQNNRWRQTQIRSSAFLTGNPVFNQEQVFGLDRDVAYNIGANGAARRDSEQVAHDRMAEYYHHPVALVQLALTASSTVGNLRQEDGQTVIDVTSADGNKYALYVDPTTSWPSQIVSEGYHPNLGDVTLTTEFDDYQETGGLGGFQARLILPRRISARNDEWLTWDVRVSVDHNLEIEDISAPEEARSAEALTLQVNVEVEELADGIWHLAGQSHHSVLVAFDEFLALVEAPLDDTRTMAVIQQARELYPDRPLRYLVNTHHHFDHSGGVRAAVSEGLTLITHERNRMFFEDVVLRPHARRPDALERNAQALTIETVSGDEVFELSSGRRTLQIMRITEDEHSDSILMAYLPRERILIEADAFSVGSRAAPFAANLLKNIRDRKLRVEHVVPIHGGVVGFAVLEEAVESAGRSSIS